MLIPARRAVVKNKSQSLVVTEHTGEGRAVAAIVPFHEKRSRTPRSRCHLDEEATRRRARLIRVSCRLSRTSANNGC